MKIQPVILAGGSGHRLWPLSRDNLPKQLLPLVGSGSLLQQTVSRVSGEAFHPPIVICNEQYRFLVAEQLRELSIPKFEIVLEPVGRNSAPAAVVAALVAQRHGHDTLVLLLPSDHAIDNLAGFLASVDDAALGAGAGHLMTFGVKPGYASTEFGYIHASRPINGAPNCSRVDKFEEKPVAERAQEFVTSGQYVWNSGMFLFRADVFLNESDKFEHDLVAHARAAFSHAQRDLDFIRLSREHFERAKPISIDYAVMERTSLAGVCALRSSWSDLGTWASIWEAMPKDAHGNALRGDAVVRDGRDCLVLSEEILTCVVGVDDIAVITTDDAVLVTKKDKAGDLKKLVEQLKAQGRPEVQQSSTTHRPWGKYRNIDLGSRYQVKLITVQPGASISLQLHHHRSEHWIVVQGQGQVTRGEEIFELHENQSTFIPVGVKHRLENVGKVPLQIVEVQTGGYLGEDDIVRFEDRYGRVPG